MSLINDPLYLIHISRIKFLRMDERGERIISFPPTVMSDDYVRLAAPVYPEMQYCYSPVYDSFLNNEGHVTATNITSSPRTTKRNYRQRKQMTNIPNMRYNQYIAPGGTGGGGIGPGTGTGAAAMVAGQTISSRIQESNTDSEDDDIEVDKQTLLSSSGKPVLNNITSPMAAAGPLTIGTVSSVTRNALSPSVGPSTTTIANRSFPNTSLHPSVDSAIDPSPRSSIDDNAHPAFVTLTPHTATDVEETVVNGEPPLPSSATTITSTANIPPPPPLEYTKKNLVASQRAKTSALSALIAEKATAAENPFAEFSFVSGKGESKSIKLCVYLPTSNKPYTPVSLVVRPDAITDDVIGYILYDYVEQKREPELDEAAYDLAEWVLLIAEDDGEIEDDLPAIDRTRNIGRVSFDQFALCRATPSQAKQNDIDRARMGRSKPDLETLRKKKAAMASPSVPAASTQQHQQHHHQEDQQAQSADNNDAAHFEMSPPYANMTSDESMAQTYTTHLMSQQQHQEPDASTVAVPVPSSKATLTKATMPMKPLKDFRIKLMTSEEVSATTSIPVYADMFIGDVLELVSRKRKLDPNQYMLTIADTNIIVQNDTTVESLKGITDLTFTKKGTALSIPSSTHLWRSPIKRKKDEVNHPMYFSTTESPTAGPSTANANEGLFSQYKKYNVSRKMPMFVSKRVYILAIDGDYIHLMPPEHKGMFDSVKTTSFHASAVRSCKQSKKVPTNFKIMILKERDFKTYDLEAENAKEANEICARIKLLMQVTKGV